MKKKINSFLDPIHPTSYSPISLLLFATVSLKELFILTFPQLSSSIFSLDLSLSHPSLFAPHRNCFYMPLVASMLLNTMVSCQY